MGKLCQDSIFDDNFTTMINPLHINIMAYNSTPMTFDEVNNTRKFAVEKSENTLIYGTRIITYKDKKSFFSKLIYILLQAVVDYQAIVYSVFIFEVSLFLGNPVDQSLFISVLAAILLIPKFILSVRNNDTLHKTHLIMNEDYTFSTLQKRIMIKHGLGAFNLKKSTHLVTLVMIALLLNELQLKERQDKDKRIDKANGRMEQVTLIPTFIILKITGE